MLDFVFLERKLKLMGEDLDHLVEYKDLTVDDAAKDFRTSAVVEHILERVIMRAIDINQHVISELGKGSERVRSYQDTFLIASQLGVFPEDFAQKIAPSSGLRNALIHDYDEVDPALLQKSIGEALDQYAQYRAYLFRFIEERQRAQV